ncbi:discoidin domain-containing protein [Amedibacillus dolichus]|uniref:exo-alpha-sialidase n=1 Tax=Amedibacillus dolichus TaxID=31971 RepID=A0ABT7UEY1_9FIRM|nr:discoidin domain-containing protein [Amedibacillus dolichus]MDM8157965.1 discoidin domain-containing protein [Amedibacillus dolichus]
MKKTNVYSVLLASMLGLTSVVPAAMWPVAAQTVRAVTPTATYAQDGAVTVNGGTNAIDASNDVGLFNNQEDFTVNLTFTSTGSGVQSLFFMGNSTMKDHYITVYLNGKTLGVESRDASGSQQINGGTVTLNEVDFTTPHKLTFTVDGGNYYRFYLDGQKVKEGTLSGNFSADLFEDANYMGFGNGNRSGGGNNYPFTGTLSDIELYDSALSEEDIIAYYEGALGDTVYTYQNAYYADASVTHINDSANINDVKDLSEGSITIRYRLNESASGPMMLYSVSDSTQARKYLGFYVNPTSNEIGFDHQGYSGYNFAGKTLDLNNYNVSVNDTNWHTITVTKADDAIRFYLDGRYLDQYTAGVTSGFWNTVDNANSIGIGFVDRSEGNSEMPLSGAIDVVKVYNSVLSEADIQQEHAQTTWTVGEEVDMSNAHKSDPYDLYYSGYNGSSAYRIPSLLTTTAGTQLAFIDERNTGSGDAGNIDLVVRRKTTDDAEFSDPITLVDLPNNGASAAFAIDAVTVQDEKSGRIFAIVDMFPESSGLMDTSQLTTGSGYKEVDGEQLQVLYTNDGTREEFGVIKVMEDGYGHVLDAEGNDTGYLVIVSTENGESMQEIGNLYKEGEYKGNIYMLKNGPDKGELTVLNTTYLWMVYSDDDGATWSDPVDITPQVKEDWMLFLGTGPGVGIQLDNGNLVVPVYHSNSNVGASQSSAVIISEDGGETWTIGESPQKLRGYDPSTMTGGGMLTESQAVQLNNGNVLLFMRNNYSGKVQVATSTDGGLTWDSIKDAGVTDVYCQLSVLHYTKSDGSEWILLSNPAGSGRNNGTVHLGQVNDDGTINWTHSRLIKEGYYAYSCLTLVDDSGEHADNPLFALMYEGDNIAYTTFDENYIKAGMIEETMDAPQMTNATAEINGDQVTVTLRFDQNVLAAGQPQLNLTLGDTEFAATYVSGSGSDTIVFRATLPQGASGVLRNGDLNLTNGVLENMQNMIPTLEERDLYDLTEINDGLSIHDYSSQHSNSTAENTDGAAVNVLDGNVNTYWHSTWNQSIEHDLPQWVTVDLGEDKTIYKVGYIGRQNGSNGRYQNYEIAVSMDGEDFTVVQTGTLENTASEQMIEFVPTQARYVRFTALSVYGSDQTVCSMAEMSVHEYSEGIFVQGDKTELRTLVETAGTLLEEDYTTATWETLQEALLQANTILESDGVTSQAMIDHAAQQLDQAMSGLIDLSRVSEELQKISELVEGGFTSGSWENLMNAANDAQQQVASASSAKEITDIVQKLRYAVSQLEAVDRSELRSAIHAAQALTETDYTVDSWSALAQALEDAIAADGDQSLDQQAIDVAKDALTAAQEQLVALDREALDAAITSATEALAQKDQYTPGTVAALETALKEAQEVRATSRDQAAIDAAAEKLQTAIEALQKKADKSALQEAVEKANAIDLDAYTEESAAALQEALQEAQTVLDDPEADQQSVDEAAQALLTAIENLEEKAPADEEKPDDGEEKPVDDDKESPEQTPSDKPSDEEDPATAAASNNAAYAAIIGAAGGATLLLLHKKRKNEE